MSNRENIQNIFAVEDVVQQQHQLYNRKVDEVQQLLEELKENLEQAKNDLRSAVRGPPLLLPGTLTDSLMKTFDLCSSACPQDVPSGDAPQASGLSALLQTAVGLADL